MSTWEHGQVRLLQWVVFGLRILVVEDNDEISEAMSFYCSAKQEIECNVTNNGQEGLERIRNDKFDLILLDIAMPDFSGWDVLQSLKKDGVIESKNIVIFTASSDQNLFNELKNAGIKEIFKKPFSLDQLTALIEKYRTSAWYCLTWSGQVSIWDRKKLKNDTFYGVQVVGMA